MSGLSEVYNIFSLDKSLFLLPNKENEKKNTITVTDTEDPGKYYTQTQKEYNTRFFLFYISIEKKLEDN